MKLPRLVVFDLDQCLWSPEMYLLREIPTERVYGELPNGVGKGTTERTFCLN